jgi:maleylacetate reductase
MTATFTYHAHPAHIVFGAGTLHSLPDELRRLGVHRPLLLSTPFPADGAHALAARLGLPAEVVFAHAAMHTPVEVTAQALVAFEAAGADGVVALGGGSTIGLGKAIAYRRPTPQVAIPTTYAGSEVTPILGQTSNGEKTTLRDARVLPTTVIYDPELTLDLPVPMSVTSGLNAMAHAVEAVYAPDHNPVATLMAVEGTRALRDALPRIALAPRDPAARTQALYGAWLCGTVLGSVGMSLHHKLCHTLGGSFGLPHAETHAVVLPHAVAYNTQAAATQLRPLADLFGGDLASGLQAFARSLGAPLALKDLGLQQAQLDTAADLACQKPYANPRPIQREAIRDLLQRAWEGAAPR